MTQICLFQFQPFSKMFDTFFSFRNRARRPPPISAQKADSAPRASRLRLRRSARQTRNRPNRAITPRITQKICKSDRQCASPTKPCDTTRDDCVPSPVGLPIKLPAIHNRYRPKASPNRRTKTKFCAPRFKALGAATQASQVLSTAIQSPWGCESSVLRVRRTDSPRVEPSHAPSGRSASQIVKRS